MFPKQRHALHFWLFLAFMLGAVVGLHAGALMIASLPGAWSWLTLVLWTGASSVVLLVMGYLGSMILTWRAAGNIEAEGWKELGGRPLFHRREPKPGRKTWGL